MFAICQSLKLSIAIEWYLENEEMIDVNCGKNWKMFLELWKFSFYNEMIKKFHDFYLRLAVLQNHL